jgi:hypothetical protein
MNTRCHTFTGQGFDPFDPRPEDVRLEDIAHHLALTNRYGGATPVYYSVAEHAVRVADCLLKVFGDPRVALAGLHHDDSEAYFHDIRRPIKHKLVVKKGGLHGKNCSFAVAEARILKVVFDGLGIEWPSEDTLEKVELADLSLLWLEMAGLFDDPPPLNIDVFQIGLVVPGNTVSWGTAKSLYLEYHRDLMQKVEATKC